MLFPLFFDVFEVRLVFGKEGDVACGGFSVNGHLNFDFDVVDVVFNAGPSGFNDSDTVFIKHHLVGQRLL